MARTFPDRDKKLPDIDPEHYCSAHNGGPVTCRLTLGVTPFDAGEQQVHVRI